LYDVQILILSKDSETKIPPFETRKFKPIMWLASGPSHTDRDAQMAQASSYMQLSPVGV